MKEIEILFRLEESKDSAFEKLKELEDKGIKRTIDYYYYFPEDEKFKPNEKGEILNWFRIRKKGDKTYFTFKHDYVKENGLWSHSDEYETEVSDFETAKKIVESMGMKPLITVDNTKHIFVKDDFELVVEDVKDLGLFLEVEILNAKEDADVEKERKRIFEFVKSLNLVVGKELNIGKPELMLNKNN
ncbi:class IV adenylate cyclase [Candidatus Woesearchaeota archaeon]|nr:class IV adenylate cyclase [Candidatus Woesearchaeota archaeon]